MSDGEKDKDGGAWLIGCQIPVLLVAVLALVIQHAYKDNHTVQVGAMIVTIPLAILALLMLFEDISS